MHFNYQWLMKISHTCIAVMLHLLRWLYLFHLDFASKQCTWTIRSRPSWQHKKGNGAKEFVRKGEWVFSVSRWQRCHLELPTDALSGPSAMVEKSAHGVVVKRSLAAYDLVKRWCLGCRFIELPFGAHVKLGHVMDMSVTISFEWFLQVCSLKSMMKLRDKQ